MLKKLLLSLSTAFLLSCSTQRIATCTNTVTEKRDILGATETVKTCSCNCPQSSQSVLDAGGIIGGLTNLWSSNN